MVLGVILDVLTVRPIGISSLAILAFLGVLSYLRRSFSGNLRVEGLWLLLSAVTWNWFLGTRSGFVLLGLIVVGVVIFYRQVAVSEIKLK